MGLFDKIDHRTKVMTRMAQTLDVDFAEVIAQAPEAVREYRQAVLRCVSCGHEGECTAWMAEHPHAAETPDYCRNKDILESLAKV
ncbi:MAG: DUF6455 family protein [Rhodobacterales bacterium]|nr:DUF6455 family protein [Rhodobacterales bacterium]MDX5413875.1 DUF6455 family protein [Rhodobacterales bacterium]